MAVVSSEEVESCLNTLRKICRGKDDYLRSIAQDKPQFGSVLKQCQSAMERASGMSAMERASAMEINKPGFKEMKQEVPKIAQKRMELTVSNFEKQLPRYRPALVAPDEERRMKVVRSLEILDTEEDEYTNNILWLATQICNTEIGAISVVDKNRQFFKAAMGLGVRETCRDAAFCSHAILQPNKMMVVEDALEDDRFAQNPLVTGPPHIRFYAGMPLIVDGQPLGTVCVISARPMRIGDAQKTALKNLAKVTENHLKHLRANRRLSEAYRRAKSTELALKEAKDKAEALARSRTKFLGIMAHELRTPVNAIHGYAQLIKERLPSMPASDAECIDSIIYGSNILASTVNTVLDYLKLCSGKAGQDKSTSNIRRIVRSTADLLTSLATNKEIDFKIEVDSTLHTQVCVDRLKFTHIINNLVCNAIKFTPKGKKVKMTVKRVSSEQPLSLPKNTVVVRGECSYAAGNMEMKHNYIIVEVEDEGRGIPGSMINNIFEPFQQESNMKRVYGGTGLGLAIVRGNVEVMGGRIFVKSEIDRGSKFSALIPYAKVCSNTNTSGEKRRRHRQLSLPPRCQVVVAEDDFLSQKLIKRYLTSAGLDCTICKDGKVLVETVSKILNEGGPTPIIITDVEMPHMGGIEAMERLRKLEGEKRLYIVALTASTMALKDHDFNAVLLKPINFKSLTDTLADIFQRISLAFSGD